MLEFSWRLNERIFVCPVPKNDSVRWNCIPPRRGQRPRWYGLGGTAQVVEHLGYPTRQ